MKTIYAAPYLQERVIGKDTVTVLDFQTALNRAGPGDTVVLVPGRYTEPVTIARGGEAGSPITIRPHIRGSVTFDGLRAPNEGRYHQNWAMDGNWSFVKAFFASHLVFEDLDVVNCWPNAFYFRGGSDITVRNIRAVGGRNVVYARSAIDHLARRFLLEDITWVQDPTHEMWEGRVSWLAIKGQTGDINKSWFNGALFQSYNLGGDVIVRRCSVSHAFNGVRMVMDDLNLPPDTPEFDLPFNQNVRIYDNAFSYIRDNAIEPEGGAQGWLVTNNSFFQNHAALSLDRVALNGFAFVGNTILNVSRPKDASNEGGKVIKFFKYDPKKPPKTDDETIQPSLGFVTAFNAVRTRAPYVKKAAFKAWRDANNAIERFADTDKDSLVLLDRFDIRAPVEINPVLTNAAEYPTAYAAAGSVDWAAKDRIFVPPAFCEDLDQPMGGWDGTLDLDPKLKTLEGAGVTLHGPEGQVAEVPAGLCPGQQTLEALGVAGWLHAPWEAATLKG